MPAAVHDQWAPIHQSLTCRYAHVVIFVVLRMGARVIIPPQGGLGQPTLAKEHPQGMFFDSQCEKQAVHDPWHAYPDLRSAQGGECPCIISATGASAPSRLALCKLDFKLNQATWK